MADSDRNDVRAPDRPFDKRSSSSGTYRYIGAPIVRADRLDSAHVSVELLERRREGTVDWRYRQDRHALFLFERGVQACEGLVDGRTLRRPIRGECNLAFVAAGSAIDSAIEMSASCRYIAIFFDAVPMLSDDEHVSGNRVPSSRIGFSNPLLANSLAELRREVEEQDDVSRLMLEGWALQAWALLLRHAASGNLASPGALGAPGMRRVSEYMNARLAEDVTVDELADLVGLSSRQFCRRFQASAGVSPGRALREMRLERAAELLLNTRKHITEIALDCGFSQPQHFATSFRRRFGLSPTRYRSMRTQ